MIFNILLIAIITVIVIDLSGFVQSLESGLSKWLHIPSVHIPRPFSCSLCSSFWLSIIYVIIIGKFTILNVAIILLISYMTPIIKDTLIFLKDMASQIITILYKLFGI